MRKPSAAILVVLALAAGVSVWAEKPVQGLFLDQNLQGSYNPAGVQLATKLFYRLPLNEGDGVLWETAKIEAGLCNSLSPAYDFAGAYVDIEPIAVFDLELKVQRAAYFDALGFGFQDLAGYSSDFDSSALKDIPDRNASGWILSAAPTLKAAVGRLAFSNTLHINYFNVDGGEGYFYETYGNCALAKKDIELFNDAYLLWMFDGGFMAGLNESLLGVPNSGYRSQILQAVGVADKELSKSLSLYGALTAGIYLEDEYLQYKPRFSGMLGLTYKIK